MRPMTLLIVFFVTIIGGARWQRSREAAHRAREKFVDDSVAQVDARERAEAERFRAARIADSVQRAESLRQYREQGAARQELLRQRRECIQTVIPIKHARGNVIRYDHVPGC